MNTWIPPSKDGTRRLAHALGSPGVDRIMLGAGCYQAANLLFDREVELIGSSGTRLAGPLRIGSRGRLRLSALAIDGGLVVERFGILHLDSCVVALAGANAGVSLASQSLALLTRSVIDGGAGVALWASKDAQAKVDQCRIAADVVAVSVARSAIVAMVATQVIGMTIMREDDGQGPGCSDHPSDGLGGFVVEPGLAPTSLRRLLEHGRSIWRGGSAR